MIIHIHHHLEFDEEHPLHRLVKSVDQNVRTILHRTGIIMAQLDDLMNALNAISTDVGSVLTRVSALEQQLQDLQNNTSPEVDLTGAIALASSIREQLEGTQAAASNATAPAAGDEVASGTGDVAQPQEGEATTNPSVDGSEAGGEPTDGPPV